MSPVPASYIQERHLRNYAQQAEAGSDHSRLLIAVCEVHGKCDIRAMTYVINAHLRRHDTYRSWFEYRDADHIVRHTIADPADIEFTPTEHGEKDAAQLRDHILATPDPLQWDCFSFGVVQRSDRFTFYASIDHLHADGQFVGVGLMEFQTMYATLIMGEPPVAMGQSGSYDDYCVRQRRYSSALTAETPEVRRWIEFAETNGGSFPDFPLPLGDRSEPYGGDLLSMTLLDEKQTERFESACLAAGSRFIGGMFACIALALYELTGAEVYAGTTPKDTRSNQSELTTQGWFTGLTPVTVPVVAASFADTARAAQVSFDAGLDLAQVPFERVVELAPSLDRPRPLFSQVNFFDALAGPLAMLTKMFDEVTLGAYSDGRFTYPLSTIVGRFDETTVSVLFPNNPVARESITQYLGALKSVCARAADGWTPSRKRNPAELSQQSAH